MKSHAGLLTREKTLGEKNYNWKGDDVKYAALHRWVSRTLGKPTVCSDCGETKKRIEWANISGKYKRDVSDWKQLCVVCHRYFDGIAKLTKEQAKSIKERWESGERQIPLAKEFCVDQGTISNIVNGKIKAYV